MTSGSSDRLDRIEALLLETTQVARSNAKSIQGLADRIAELTHVQEDATEEREELRQATIGIATIINLCVIFTNH